MSLDWLDVIEKTIAMIYSSPGYQKYLRDRQNRQRHKRSQANIDTHNWKMDKRWTTKMDRIIEKGTAIERNNDIWKKNYYRRGVNARRKALREAQKAGNTG